MAKEAANGASRELVLRPKPRIYYSHNSGVWWCVSKNDRPQHVSLTGVKIYHRIGNGSSPAEAYQVWKEW